MSTELTKTPDAAKRAKNQSEPTKRIEWATFIIAVVTGLGLLYKFERYERPIFEADAREAGEQRVAVEAQALGVSSFVLIDNVSYPVRPVIVTISNIGRAPIETSLIELRVFKAKTSDVTVLEERVDYETRLKGPDQPYLGVIDIRSKGWKEVQSLRLTDRAARRTIRQGESRQTNFHVMSSCYRQNEVVKLAASVHPAEEQGWEVQTWEGFADPALCGPIAEAIPIGFDAPTPAPVPDGPATVPPPPDDAQHWSVPNNEHTLDTSDVSRRSETLENDLTRLTLLVERLSLIIQFQLEASSRQEQTIVPQQN